MLAKRDHVLSLKYFAEITGNVAFRYIDDYWCPLGRGVGCVDCGLGVACTFVALATYLAEDLQHG